MGHNCNIDSINQARLQTIGIISSTHFSVRLISTAVCCGMSVAMAHGPCFCFLHILLGLLLCNDGCCNITLSDMIYVRELTVMNEGTDHCCNIGFQLLFCLMDLMAPNSQESYV